jgi:ADP-ribosylglycohydrolase
MSDDHRKAMVLGSFVGDSLALGVHWIYDTGKIREVYGRVESLLAPGKDSYHPTKERGEFTHYGDQTLILLESLASRGIFDLYDFEGRWRNLFQQYRGYVDKATKATLGNFSAGAGPEAAGSSSDDLAGAARIAPLVYRYHDDLDGLLEAAKAQTRMTHNTPEIIESAEFFAAVAWKVLKGTGPVSAMEQVSGERFKGSVISKWMKAGIQSTGNESVETIARFGQSCHSQEAFPGVVHLLSTYEADLKEGLIQSVMAGGDSAARAMIVGMVLGAYLGEEALPAEWLSGLKKGTQILKLLERIS